jgi:hypothetical protein
MQLSFDYWPGMDITMLGGTFTRATTATQIDRLKRVRTVASGVLRDGHFINGIRHALIEEARTQRCTQPQTPNAWGTWGTVGSNVTTTGQVDPWDTSVALRLSKVGSAAEWGRSVAASFSADGSGVATFAVAEDTIVAAGLYLSIFDNTAAVHRHRVSVTFNGASAPTVATVGGSGTIFPSVEISDSAGRRWWLISFSTTGIVAANTNLLTCHGNTTATGAWYFAGANAWTATFPSSWQPTSGHVRNADLLSFSYTPFPQALTLYADGITLGAANQADLSYGITTMAQIGSGATGYYAGIRLDAGAASRRVQSLHRNTAAGTQQTSTVGSGTVGYGTRVQGVTQLYADGSVQAHQALDGGSTASAVQSAAFALSGGWDSQVVQIGQSNGSVGGWAIRNVRILVDSSRSLATMATPLSYIRFTDSEGTVYLSNERPFPANRFSGWTPDDLPIGDSSPRLSDGAVTMFRTRSEYGASFELTGIPSKLIDGAIPVELATRLKYHLLNGGTCLVQTGDAVGSNYSPCGLKPGSAPALSLTDRRMIEYTLSLQLIHLATTPARMTARYIEQ